MWLVRGVTIASLLALLVPSVPLAHRQDAPVDAGTFAVAFQAGTADQFKGRIIAGTGYAFGMSAPAVLITVGAAGDDTPVTPVTTLEQFTAAENARTTLQVMVSVAGFDPRSMSADRRHPNAYAFSGVYNGRMRTVGRPQAPNGVPDTGACPAQPDDPPTMRVVTSGPTTFHCVPLIESGTLQPK
jgi:hypothetical protein